MVSEFLASSWKFDFNPTFSMQAFPAVRIKVFLEKKAKPLLVMKGLLTFSLLF
jgi:hypothetical protein